MITSIVLLATLFLIQARMLLDFLAAWALCWLLFSRLLTNTPRSFSTRQLSSHSSPSLHGAVVTQVQDLAFGLVETHTTNLGPSIQPVQIPLQSLPTLEQKSQKGQGDDLFAHSVPFRNPGSLRQRESPEQERLDIQWTRIKLGNI